VPCDINKCPPTPFDIKRLHQNACHGRGRGFESRRPRHIFNDLQCGCCSTGVQLGCGHCRLHSHLHWQDGLDQFLLSLPLGVRRRLQILVCYIEVAVARVVAECELMLAHFSRAPTRPMAMPRCSRNTAPWASVSTRSSCAARRRSSRRCTTACRGTRRTASASGSFARINT
jgi:hypothetical protein